MIRLSELKVPLDESFDCAGAGPAPLSTPALARLIPLTLGIREGDIARWQIFKRSFDARRKPIQVVYIVDVELRQPGDEPALLRRFAGHSHIHATPDMQWRMPVSAPADWAPPAGLRPVVVGFGPCGIFAALALAQMGLRPLVLERGKTVRLRTKDTWGLWRRRELHPESNVQFGEGGAGTFSDGKLYSQIRDPRFLGRKVMKELVAAGAPEEILHAAHPHIGTFKLVKVVENLRARIIALGGEVRFEQRVTDILVETNAAGDKQLRGLQVTDAATGGRQEIAAEHVIFALGHSARDTFTMLHRHGVAMAAKPFSVGFRIEHPQSLIDRARWGQHAGHPLLGAADYKLVHHAANGRTAYSFCMCPGGTVVAATSETGRVVTNGMSQYSRNERNANAGIVVGIEPEDFPNTPVLLEQHLANVRQEDHATPARVHPLAGIVLQRQLESRAFTQGGEDYSAPGQRVEDFIAGRPSTRFGDVTPSYRPGVTPTDLASALPGYAIEAIREALPEFDRKIRGFALPDAILTGVETRTSSPLRIARGEDFQSPNLMGCF
ncbi:MAG: FAD-dependent oxidoreductase, partial [Betaproteobacteria bacterium]|nr:FAD-dependent oxidoreductase [Betaproteobacteria bacterium]